MGPGSPQKALVGVDSLGAVWAAGQGQRQEQSHSGFPRDEAEPRLAGSPPPAPAQVGTFLTYTQAALGDQRPLCNRDEGGSWG